MQQVIELMSGIFFAIVLVFTGIGIASAFVTNGKAIGFKTETIALLEDCNYDAEVVNACYTNAEKNGFALIIRFFYEDGSVRTMSSPKASDDLMNGITHAKVTVKYPFKIGVLELNTLLSTSGTSN